MNKAIAAVLLIGFLLPHYTLAAPAKTTTLEDQKKVSVTIYNQNLALIKDQRTLTLDKGIQVLDFREVSARSNPRPPCSPEMTSPSWSRISNSTCSPPRLCLKSMWARKCWWSKPIPPPGKKPRSKPPC